MKTQTRSNILQYIQKNGRVRAHEIIIEFHIGAVAVHRHLKRLTEEKQITKWGTPPRVYYAPASEIADTDLSKPLPPSHQEFDNYLYISPIGELYEGEAGFEKWVAATGETAHLEKLKKEYITSLAAVNKHRLRNGWIDATARQKTIVSPFHIDKVLYQDFYSIPKFGKTRLGQYILYAKQTQNRYIMHNIINLMLPFVRKICTQFKIDAIVFVPPTVKRELQLMKEMERAVRHAMGAMPLYSLQKTYKGEVRVAQKSLSRLADRIENARETIVVPSLPPAKSILIIDDAIGSGATINEIAAKLKTHKSAKNVIAFGLVGSFNGFDVIKEI